MESSKSRSSGKGLDLPLLSGRDIKLMLGQTGSSPKKSLGQNFVVDPNTVRKIVRLADVGPNDRVIEVGPGLGSLTRAVLEAAPRELVLIEKDARIAERLTGEMPPEVQVIEGDALSVDISSLLADEGEFKMVANLPYNAGTAILLHFLENEPRVTSGVVMLQREVAQRLVAPHGSRTYGAISVKAQSLASLRLLSGVSRHAFLPVPNVESALVGFETKNPRLDPGIHAEVFALVDRGFRSRRKMLRSCLDSSVLECLVELGISAESRAEQVSVEDWVKIAQCSCSRRPS